MLTAFAMICSCQRQDSTAEQQLAQRKTELDARETALDEREKAVAEREKAVAEREKAMANSRTIPADAAQANSERDRRIQQLPADARALVPDSAQINAARAEKERLKQERLSQTQGGLEELQSNRQRKLEAIQKWQMSGGAASSAAEITSPTPSPAGEANSVVPSLTPE